VLDAAMQLVPIGVQGELYVGGVPLARGYLGRADLTAERFVPHPLSTAPGARLYRTGDLVRVLPDGRLAFVGRRDWQVKLRGYRIELGEIEQVLLDHPSVREGVVVLREDERGSNQLVAYLVPAQQEVVLELQARVRRWLGERLPQYMVPCHILVLDSLPLTASGKVDRGSLPVPEPHEEEQPPSSRPPSAIEQRLLPLWSQVLGLAQVGIHDNFFALGGDSILSLSLVAQARQAGLHLTVKQVFQAPTIAQLSPLVTPLAPAADSSTQPRARSTGRLPLTPIQHWFFQQRVLNPHHWNQTLLLQVPADLSLPLLEQALQWVFAQQDVFGLRFVQTDPDDWQASYLPTVEPLPFSVVQVPALPLAQQTQWIEQRASQEQGRLHLSAGPLARALLFRLADTQPARLLLVCHHLVMDAVSWRILVQEVSQSYARVRHGESLLPLPASSSYQDWAQYLLEAVQSEAMQQQVAFWLEQALPPSSIPEEHSPGATREDTAEQIEQLLSVPETQALLHQVPQRLRASVEEVLLTALALGLYDGVGNSSLLLALEGHGREELGAHLDLSRTVGWFTSLFPLRLELGTHPEPLTALRLIKRQLRQVPQRGVGYGLLRYLHPDPQLRGRLQQQPQPGVSFNYLGQFDQVLGATTLFALAAESPGWQRAPSNQRVHQLEVLAWVVGERLHLLLQYSPHLYHRHHVEQVARCYLAHVQHLISFTQTAVFRRR
jgi:non-ribosomal peptide synthase protein (TIGR01720 family)